MTNYAMLYINEAVESIENLENSILVVINEDEFIN